MSFNRQFWASLNILFVSILEAKPDIYWVQDSIYGKDTLYTLVVRYDPTGHF